MPDPTIFSLSILLIVAAALLLGLNQFIEGKPTSTRLHFHLYNTADTGWRFRTAEWGINLTWFTNYVGAIAKGWYIIGPFKGAERFRIEFAIGGEDNMVQLKIQVPWLGLCAIGIRIPRKLTSWWIYERRTWGIQLGPCPILSITFGYDDHGMASFYARMRNNGETPKWNWLTLWPGLRFSKGDTWRVANKLLGEQKTKVEQLRTIETIIPMPEGNYPCQIRMQKWTWNRPRWPFGRKVITRADIEMLTGIPVPGKGENSWDLDDTAISSCMIKARNVPEAVGYMVTSSLQDRARGSSIDWQPTEGWPEGLEVRS